MDLVYIWYNYTCRCWSKILLSPIHTPADEIPIDLFNVIVFIRATDHVITMLCHMTNNFGWQKHFRFH